jgi:uncharacterized caspase-like protein
MPVSKAGSRTPYSVGIILRKLLEQSNARATGARRVLAVLVILFPCMSAIGQDRGLGIRRANSEEGHGRFALVIGNGSYRFSPLRNSVTDAKDMADALSEFGFEVICKTDVGQNEMKRAIREFGERIQQRGIGLFYYAGHAVQVDGRNYLIPVGAEINHEREVEYEGVNVEFVLLQMQEAHNQLKIVILDACRNNPFGRRFRSGNYGLATINAPSGTLIAYATAPGSVASDGDGRNGLYTQQLLKAMREPGLKIEDVFKRVRLGVDTLTGGTQVPWESSSLVGDFYFLPVTGKLVSSPNLEGGTSTPARSAHNDPLPEGPTAEIKNNRSPLSNAAAEVFVNQGDASAREKDWGQAEKEYSQAVELDPTNPRLRAKLGDALSQQKKWSDAATQFAAAVRLDPQNRSYQNRLTAAKNKR